MFRVASSLRRTLVEVLLVSLLLLLLLLLSTTAALVSAVPVACNAGETKTYNGDTFSTVQEFAAASKCTYRFTGITVTDRITFQALEESSVFIDGITCNGKNVACVHFLEALTNMGTVKISNMHLQVAPSTTLPTIGVHFANKIDGMDKFEMDHSYLAHVGASVKGMYFIYATWFEAVSNVRDGLFWKNVVVETRLSLEQDQNHATVNRFQGLATNIPRIIFENVTVEGVIKIYTTVTNPQSRSRSAIAQWFGPSPVDVGLLQVANSLVRVRFYTIEMNPIYSVLVFHAADAITNTAIDVQNTTVDVGLIDGVTIKPVDSHARVMYLASDDTSINGNASSFIRFHNVTVKHVTSLRQLSSVMSTCVLCLSSSSGGNTIDLAAPINFTSITLITHVSAEWGSLAQVAVANFTGRVSNVPLLVFDNINITNKITIYGMIEVVVLRMDGGVSGGKVLLVSRVEMSGFVTATMRTSPRRAGHVSVRAVHFPVGSQSFNGWWRFEMTDINMRDIKAEAYLDTVNVQMFRSNSPIILGPAPAGSGSGVDGDTTRLLIRNVSMSVTAITPTTIANGVWVEVAEISHNIQLVQNFNITQIHLAVRAKAANTGCRVAVLYLRKNTAAGGSSTAAISGIKQFELSNTVLSYKPVELTDDRPPGMFVSILTCFLKMSAGSGFPVSFTMRNVSTDKSNTIIYGGNIGASLMGIYLTGKAARLEAFSHYTFKDISLEVSDMQSATTSDAFDTSLIFFFGVGSLAGISSAQISCSNVALRADSFTMNGAGTVIAAVFFIAWSVTFSSLKMENSGVYLRFHTPLVSTVSVQVASIERWKSYGASQPSEMLDLTSVNELRFTGCYLDVSVTNPSMVNTAAVRAIEMVGVLIAEPVTNLGTGVFIDGMKLDAVLRTGAGPTHVSAFYVRGRGTIRQMPDFDIQGVHLEADVSVLETRRLILVAGYFESDIMNIETFRFKNITIVVPRVVSPNGIALPTYIGSEVHSEKSVTDVDNFIIEQIRMRIWWNLTGPTTPCQACFAIWTSGANSQIERVKNIFSVSDVDCYMRTGTRDGGLERRTRASARIASFSSNLTDISKLSFIKFRYDVHFLTVEQAIIFIVGSGDLGPNARAKTCWCGINDFEIRGIDMNAVIDAGGTATSVFRMMVQMNNIRNSFVLSDIKTNISVSHKAAGAMHVATFYFPLWSIGKISFSNIHQVLTWHSTAANARVRSSVLYTADPTCDLIGISSISFDNISTRFYTPHLAAVAVAASEHDNDVTAAQKLFDNGSILEQSDLMTFVEVTVFQLRGNNMLDVPGGIQMRSVSMTGNVAAISDIIFCAVFFEDYTTLNNVGPFDIRDVVIAPTNMATQTANVAHAEVISFPSKTTVGARPRLFLKNCSVVTPVVRSRAVLRGLMNFAIVDRMANNVASIALEDCKVQRALFAPSSSPSSGSSSSSTGPPPPPRLEVCSPWNCTMVHLRAGGGYGGVINLTNCKIVGVNASLISLGDNSSIAQSQTSITFRDNDFVTEGTASSSSSSTTIGGGGGGNGNNAEPALAKTVSAWHTLGNDDESREASDGNYYDLQRTKVVVACNRWSKAVQRTAVAQMKPTAGSVVSEPCSSPTVTPTLSGTSSVTLTGTVTRSRPKTPSLRRTRSVSWNATESLEATPTAGDDTTSPTSSHSPSRDTPTLPDNSSSHTSSHSHSEEIPRTYRVSSLLNGAVGDSIVVVSVISGNPQGGVAVSRQKRLLRLVQGCGDASERSPPDVAASPMRMSFGGPYDELSPYRGAALGNPIFIVVFFLGMMIVALVCGEVVNRELSKGMRIARVPAVMSVPWMVLVSDTSSIATTLLVFIQDDAPENRTLDIVSAAVGIAVMIVIPVVVFVYVVYKAYATNQELVPINQDADGGSGEKDGGAVLAAAAPQGGGGTLDVIKKFLKWFLDPHSEDYPDTMWKQHWGLYFEQARVKWWSLFEFMITLATGIAEGFTDGPAPHSTCVTAAFFSVSLYTVYGILWLYYSPYLSRYDAFASGSNCLIAIVMGAFIVCQLYGLGFAEQALEICVYVAIAVSVVGLIALKDVIQPVMDLVEYVKEKRRQQEELARLLRGGGGFDGDDDEFGNFSHHEKEERFIIPSAAAPVVVSRPSSSFSPKNHSRHSPNPSRRTFEMNNITETSPPAQDSPKKRRGTSGHDHHHRKQADKNKQKKTASSDPQRLEEMMETNSVATEDINLPRPSSETSRRRNKRSEMLQLL